VTVQLLSADGDKVGVLLETHVPIP
jgi:hypothetical protein